MSRPPRENFASPVLITDTDALSALCDRLRTETYVTVDTEFMRERTYWPELCVVQLGGVADVAVVDAQAPGLDLAPLGALLADPAVTKVFHAARQDVEIFLQLFGAVPVPLFDTQVAAMVAGFGDQVGYDSLVAGLAGGQIDKAHRFSDWSARPLSPAQVAYAAADVTHLRTVYERLTARLEREGRLSWVAEELAALAEPATYRPDPDLMWERLRPRTSNRRMLGTLRAAAAWREREAQRINIPRQRLVRDESLLEIAATAPKDADSLGRIRGITRGFAEGATGQSLLAAIAGAAALADEDLPEARAHRDGPRPSPALVALLKVLLAEKAEAHDVAPKLLASSEDIDRLATEEHPDIPALHGWRLGVYGEDAMALKQGRIALGVNGRRIKLIPTL
jgi:ribonuclease D